jgi:hypothetical protein
MAMNVLPRYRHIDNWSVNYLTAVQWRSSQLELPCWAHAVAMLLIVANPREGRLRSRKYSRSAEPEHAIAYWSE